MSIIEPEQFILNEVKKRWDKLHKKTVFNVISYILGEGKPSMIRITETSDLDAEEFLCQGDILNLWEYDQEGCHLIYTSKDKISEKETLSDLPDILDNSGIEQCTFSIDRGNGYCVTEWCFVKYEGRKPKDIYHTGTLYKISDGKYEGVNCWID